VTQIARALQCSPWTVYSYLADPANARNWELKLAYQGCCERCGTPTSGGDGPGRHRPLCRRCSGGRRRQWTQDVVIAALQGWCEHSRTGRLPSSYELDRCGLLRRGDPRAELLTGGRYPSPRTCRRLFGSYPAAAAAAARACRSGTALHTVGS
jgi:hypothetical protein